MKYTTMALMTFLLFLVFSGCAKKHSYQVEGESLIILYKNSHAKEVFLASSHDKYSYHAVTKTKNNVWEFSLPIVDEFNYFYIVDGIITLPDCRYKVEDDFGSKNCLFVYEM